MRGRCYFTMCFSSPSLANLSYILSLSSSSSTVEMSCLIPTKWDFRHPHVQNALDDHMFGVFARFCGSVDFVLCLRESAFYPMRSAHLSVAIGCAVRYRVILSGRAQCFSGACFSGFPGIRRVFAGKRWRRLTPRRVVVGIARGRTRIGTGQIAGCACVAPGESGQQNRPRWAAREFRFPKPSVLITIVFPIHKYSERD